MKELAQLAEDVTIRRITITIDDLQSDQVESVGHELDKFLTPRPWWYVVKEPHVWQENIEHEIVLERYHHDFEAFLQYIASVQYLTSPMCNQAILLLERAPFIHPGMGSCLASWTSAAFEHPYAVLDAYVSQSNGLNDSTAYVTGSDCPYQLNKFECAFLPLTYCAVPSVLTECRTPLCVFRAPESKGSASVYTPATKAGALVTKEEYKHLGLNEKAHTPLSTAQSQLFDAAQAQRRVFLERLPYGASNITNHLATPGQTESYHTLYQFLFLLRKNSWYRSLISKAIADTRREAGFGESDRCVATQIRRGDRVVRGVNMTEWCIENSAGGGASYSDKGCLQVPFGSVSLSHIVDVASGLVEDSVRFLVVSTDDEPWLLEEITSLKQSAPRWTVVYLPAPKPPADFEFHGKDAKVAGVADYQYMRSLGGTESGVLLHGSMQLVHQCEAFVGHSGSSLSLHMYSAMCVASNHTHAVCPPGFDMKNYKPLQIPQPPKVK